MRERNYAVGKKSHSVGRRQVGEIAGTNPVQVRKVRVSAEGNTGTPTYAIFAT